MISKRIYTVCILSAAFLLCCHSSSDSNAPATSGASAATISPNPPSLPNPPNSPSAPQITTEPSNTTVFVGQSATFSVVATGTAPLAYQWQKNSVAIDGASAATYTTPQTTLADNGAMYRVIVSNAAGTVTSNAASLSVQSGGSAVDVLTYHNDNMRTAQNLRETILTLANVNSTRFGKLRILPADGHVDAQPLIVSNLNVAGAVRNVVYVATEHDTVYAYDADTGDLLKQVSLLGANETTSDVRGCSQVTPEIGITATPVIDRSVGPNGTIYVVAMSKTAGGIYFQRLHALDLVTLAEQSGSPKEVQATYPGAALPNSNGNVVFDPAQYKERPGLLLSNGIVYTAWSSHCDYDPYTGWIIGYNAGTLAQSGVLNLIPNGSEGSIWQSGGGLAADAAGNIYALVANGTFETTLDANGFPNKKDFGNAFVKISMTGSPAVIDYFTMYDTIAQSAVDSDLGSGAAMLLPDIQDNAGTTWRLAVGAGKDGNVYVVNRDSMGKFNPSSNNVYQELNNIFSSGGVFSAPAYFNRTVYYANIGGTLKAFTIANGKLSTAPTSQSAASFAYPGASPSVSANGASNGIVWAVESNQNSLAVLHAYDASNLANELYNSNQAANNRDHFGNGNKFITPTIANGKVYIGAPDGVAVFGPM